jgi:REP element-mobilizing transposase RayT
MKDLPVRKNIRLKNYDYSNAGCYFVTICIQNGHEMLGKVVGATVPGRPHVELSELGNYVDCAITYYKKKKKVTIDKYVIMPNHIHLIIVIQPETGDRGRSPLHYIIRNLKSYVTKKAGFSPWQKSFHDHIIRDEAEYRKIWRYIDENPAKWDEDEYCG